MAFSQNHSMTYIDVQESNLLGISRSSQTAVPSDKRCHGHPCDAFVCTIKEGELLRVHVALYDHSTKLPLIFSSECDARETAVFRKLTVEAEAFVGAQGFSLETVNLNYSSAMRQVIMRGISVLQPPDPARLKRKLTTVPLPQPETPHTPSLNPSAAPEFGTTSQNSELWSMALGHAGTSAVKTVTMSVEEHAALRRKLERLTREKDAADTFAAQTLKDTTAQLQSAQAACAVSEARLKSMEKEASGRIQELEAQLLASGELRKASEAAAVENERRLHKRIDDLCAQNAGLQNSLKTSTAAHDALIARLNAENAKVAVTQQGSQALWQKERTTIERRYEERTAACQQLERELSTARKAYEATVVEKEQARQCALDELKTVAAKLEELSAEKEVWEATSLHFQKKARSAVERLKREKRELEEQLRQLLENRIGAAQPPVGPENPARVAVSNGSPEVEDFSLGPAFTGFAAATSGSAADFRFEPEIKVVSYHSPREILDIYGSGNMIQTAPFGRRSQNCSAYICVVERAGRPMMYLAWVLVDSGEVLICLPKQQPEGTGQYARVVQDALFYFESVGFMMNRFELSHGSERQIQALEKTGIFRHEESQIDGNPWLMIAAA